MLTSRAQSSRLHRTWILAVSSAICLLALMILFSGSHASNLGIEELVSSKGPPLVFIPGMGARDPSVGFHVNSPSGALHFSQTDITLAVHSGVAEIHQPSTSETRTDNSFHALRVSFDNGNPLSHIEGVEPLKGRVNYLIGSDPTAWRTGLKTFSAIVYREVYPGVDLRYDGTNGLLKGTFLVAPGADPDRIEWHYSNIADIRLGRFGDLHIFVSTAESSQPIRFVERAPIAWQKIHGESIPVRVRYKLQASGGVRFSFPNGYNSAYPLTIDPVLDYGSYLGGDGVDIAYQVTRDLGGDIYLVGETSSSDFPMVGGIGGPAGSRDMFVTKLSQDGTELIYSTYIGGTDLDEALGIAVDSQGNAYVAGRTRSLDFPTQNAFQSSRGGTVNDTFQYDAVILKLNPAGDKLLYSSYLGGDNFDTARAIAIDNAGNAYMTGFADDDFPVKNAWRSAYGGGFSDGFVAAFNPALTGADSLLYSTYLGGDDQDVGQSIVADGARNVYITGLTSSDDVVTVNPLQSANRGFVDALIAGFNPTGTPLFVTYFGGSQDDFGGAVNVDDQGNLYIVGRTESNNFPVRNPFQPTNRGGDLGDAFVAKLTANGGSLLFSSYLGGSDDESAVGVDTDELGNVYLSGLTRSSNFPTLKPLQGSYGGGDSDAFLVKINRTGSTVLYATYIGGSGDETGRSVDVSRAGMAIVTGNTTSTDFPTMLPLQSQNQGSTDVFVVKVSECLYPQVPPNPDADSDEDGLKDGIEEELGTDPCLPDTDGDGLLDPWEVDPTVAGAGFDLDGLLPGPEAQRDDVFGPYGIASPGSPTRTGRIPPAYGVQNLPPDPLHKDVYVEIDWQDCYQGGCPEAPFGVATLDPNHHAPDIDALLDVVAAFSRAPVDNPDGSRGIRIHFLVDEAIPHAPNCDQNEPTVRPTNFGTPQQRKNPNIIEARARSVRYAWSGHSSVVDDGPGTCPLPASYELVAQGFGLVALPDYDYSPFGQVPVGGPNIIVSLGAAWICPHTAVTTHPVCFRETYFIPSPPTTVILPGIYPARLPVGNGQILKVSVPIQNLLGMPEPDGIRQLWGRGLMHLLGHALGLTDETEIGNQPGTPGEDRNGDGQREVTGPDSYTRWDTLQLAINDKPGAAPIESFPNYEELAAQDLDGDGIPEGVDSCPGINASQVDLDSDGQGDACDRDIDADGLVNGVSLRGTSVHGWLRTESANLDPFPFDTDNDGQDNPVDGDDDGDGIEDESDNCPLAVNPTQADLDGDLTGDVCDSDADGDDILDELEKLAGSSPASPTSQPELLGYAGSCSNGLDDDGDDAVDANDAGCIDSDKDGAPDQIDACPLLADPGWLNVDGDEFGDACDSDDDNDGVADTADLCVGTPFSEAVNIDGCSQLQVDQDMDGVCDPGAPSSGPSGCQGRDNCPAIMNTDQKDLDGDGVGDACSVNLVNWKLYLPSVLKPVTDRNTGQ